jgi:acetylornithine deacetylase/succinyl-diaminopimelate desuccinylase-like protein
MPIKERIEDIDRLLEWGWLPDLAHQVFNYAVTLQQIPAPTFQEKTRAAYVAQQFAALGLKQVEIDDLFNVYGLLPGRNPGKPATLVSAHTDTVFSAETDLTIQRDGDRVYGPGLGDNCMGVAGMLGLITTLEQQHITPECDLWFVANTREEGLGDLGGMKVAFDRLHQHLGSVINLEGMAFGHIYHAGIAVRRLHITASTGGGHSWLNYGAPSAIHGIVQLGSRIAELRPPSQPRTTLNIGIIEGGQSINTIAASAGLWLDLRSEETGALNQLESKVRAFVTEAERPDLHFHVDVVGDRPAGSIPTEHPLLQTAISVLEHIGVRGSLENGSTDANIPLSRGCPAVTVGITRGGNAHRLDEYIETPPIEDGMRQLLLLTLAVCGVNP